MFSGNHLLNFDVAMVEDIKTMEDGQIAVPRTGHVVAVAVDKQVGYSASTPNASVEGADVFAKLAIALTPDDVLRTL